MGGGKFSHQAAENIFRLYSEGRGLAKTNQEPQDYLDRELANKKSLIESFQNQLTSPKSLYFSGKIYYDGKLVPQDLVKAAVQLQFAASKGISAASNLLETTQSKMSPDQKVEAQRQSEKFTRNVEMQQRIQQMIGR